jgi:hypothetical protein
MFVRRMQRWKPSVRLGGVWEVDVALHSLLTLVLDKCEWPAFKSASLSSGTELPVPFKGGLCQPHIRSGHFGGRIKLFPILGIKPLFLGLPARTLFTTPITFSWFLVENLDEDKNKLLYNSYPGNSFYTREQYSCIQYCTFQCGENSIT